MNMNFEAKLTRMDEILAAFEGQEPLSLEESLALYEEGVRLIRECTKTLEQAQAKVETLEE